MDSIELSSYSLSKSQCRAASPQGGGVSEGAALAGSCCYAGKRAPCVIPLAGAGCSPLEGGPALLADAEGGRAVLCPLLFLALLGSLLGTCLVLKQGWRIRGDKRFPVSILCTAVMVGHCLALYGICSVYVLIITAINFNP